MNFKVQKKIVLRALLALTISSWIGPCWASNESREREYAEQIESTFTTGGIVWLKVKGKKFLGLYTETEGIENQGTAIILHPMGGHPDQKKLINSLRTYLPQHNWATLSLQMPVLSNDAKENEYYSLFDNAKERIQSGINFLVSANAKNVVLIGYGLGGMMGVYFLRENNQTSVVKAIVSISLKVPKTEHKNAQITDFISEIELPFLDIFAEFDLPEVTDSARKRRISSKANLAYRQFQIEGEGHLFEHDEGLVVKRVYSWINRTFK